MKYQVRQKNQWDSSNVKLDNNFQQHSLWNGGNFNFVPKFLIEQESQ